MKTFNEFFGKKKPSSNNFKSKGASNAGNSASKQRAKKKLGHISPNKKSGSNIKRKKRFGESDQLDEMKQFNNSEHTEIIGGAVDHFYKGLNALDTADRYLKTSGQAGMIGAFHKQYKTKQLLNIIDGLANAADA